MSKNNILLDPEKITLIKNMFSPNTVTKVKSFIRVVNFYKKFIKNYALISEPLIELT